MATPAPLTPAELADAALLRDDLLGAGYTVDGIDALLGDQASAALHRDQFAAAGWQLDRLPATRASSLVRLFLLGQGLPAEAVRTAVPSCGLEGLLRLGLVRQEGDLVYAALDLRPHAEDPGPPWWLVSDLGEQVTGRSLDTDYVLGVGHASLTLAAATPRPTVERALDLGVGCGVQSLHLTRHCDEVIATDLSPRALQLAQLSFALNEVAVRCRRGDLLMPVAGECFDLIVSNPPFVITPREARVPTFTYRDGGLAGDELMRSLITSVGRHLRPGGLFVALGNWEVHADDVQPAGPPGDDLWRRRIGSWLDEARDDDGNPLDAWVIQRELVDPAEYAELWSSDGGSSGTQRDRLVRAWLDDFVARGVTAIGLGLILLRRPGPTTKPFRRLEHRPEPLPANLGPHLLACLTAHDDLPEPLGEARLRLADDVIEEREHQPGQGEPTAIRLRQRSGFGRTVQLDTAAAAFAGACDGELTVGQLAGAIADLLDLPADETLVGLTAAARGLVLDGFLSP